MLVSAIMPTRGRQAFAREALKCFFTQTWYDRELVIIDDADDPSFPDGLDVFSVQYHRMATRLTVGAKRNVACSRAQGQIIAHWDDDDHSAPERLEDQVIRLLDSGKSVSGYSSMRFTDGEKWWQYTSFDKSYAVGTSLVYTRDYWQRHPFSQVQISEDNLFIMPARSASDIVTADAGPMQWARTHPGNTSPRQINTKQWREIECFETCSLG